MVNNKYKILFSFLFFAIYIFNFQAAEAALVIQALKYIGLNQDLIGYWSFDGQDMANVTAYDRSGNSNNGVDDYVVKTSASFGLGAPRTISAWVYPRSIGGNNLQLIVSNGGGQQFRIDRVNKQLELRIGDTSGIFVEGSTNTIIFNQWNHVAVSMSTANGNVTFYVNGVPEIVSNSTTIDSGSDIYFGVNGALSAFAAVNLDEVRIYNRALSGDEIKRLYNLGR